MDTPQNSIKPTSSQMVNLDNYILLNQLTPAQRRIQHISEMRRLRKKRVQQYLDDKNNFHY
jgi:hypothetical protein